MIPKNLIQFWHDRNVLPVEIGSAMRLTRDNNPGFRVIEADDSFMRLFIRRHYGKSIARLYDLNSIPASRSDMARLMLLYEYGGIYVDASIELKRDISQILSNSVDLVVLKRDDLPIYSRCRDKAHAANGILAAPEKSKFIKRCLERVLSNLITGDANKYVNIATGPLVISQVIDEFGDQLKIKALSYSETLDNLFSLKRVKNVNNSWTCSQKDGILQPDLYLRKGKRIRKFFFFKQFAFQISVSFLTIEAVQAPLEKTAKETLIN
jgi:mannosyltransferase OCH1-like enzyme